MTKDPIYTYERPSKPCKICRGIRYYNISDNCYGCSRRKAGTVAHEKLKQRRAMDEAFGGERGGEGMYYNPRRRFKLEELKLDEFKVAEQVVYEGVDYGQ